MKNSRILAVLVVALLTLAAGDLLAQQPPVQPPVQPQGQPGQPVRRESIPGIGSGGNGPSMVALIDFERLMSNYVRSKDVRDQIKKDKEKAEKGIKDESAELEKEKEKLRDLRPNSREFRELEERLANRVAEINVRIKILQRDFQEREQRSFYQLYCEISEEVKHYADAKGIVLVMPFSSEPVDPNAPESMQRQLSKSFVYLNGPDITEPILQELNRRAVHTAKGPGAGAGQGPVNPNRTR